MAEKQSINPYEVSLPVKDGTEVLKEEKLLGSGGFSAVFELDNNKVLKITAPQREKNNIKSLEDAQELAEERQQLYKTAKEYLDDHITKTEGFIIVDSPRKRIEEIKEEGFIEDIPDSIPDIEIGVMEVTEKVNKENDIFSRNPEKLRDLYSNEKFQDEADDFSKKALDLLKNERIMLDLSDLGHVFATKTQERRTRPSDVVYDMNSLERLIRDDEEIPTFRNLVFEDGKLKVFDLFPSFEVQESVTAEEIDQIVKSVENEDFTELNNLSNKRLDKFSELTDGDLDKFLTSAETGDYEAVKSFISGFYNNGVEKRSQELIKGLKSGDYSREDIAEGLKMALSGYQAKYEVISYVTQLHFLSKEYLEKRFT